MTSGPRVVVRADASAAMGVGHVVRCFALGAALVALGARVTFASHELPEALEARARALGIEPIAVVANPASMADARGINAIASAAIVVDGYGFGPDYLAEASRGGIPVVAIDDHATGPVSGASLVVNQNIWAPPADPDRGFLFGLDHALLGPAFVRAVRPPEPVAGRVLVTMGGADPDRLGPVIAEALVGVEGISSVDLVVGAATRHLDRCLDLAAREPRVRVGHDLPHLAGVMGQARLAIVAAGGTLWEGLMAGAPMIAVDRDAVQAASVEIMLARGVLVGRLRADDVTPDRLATLVRDCLGRPDDLDRVSRSGRATVDGRGAERVARAILAAIGRDRT